MKCLVIYDPATGITMESKYNDKLDTYGIMANINARTIDLAARHGLVAYVVDSDEEATTND